MKSFIIFVLYGILSVCQIYSQNNDSIFLFGCEDNWDSIEKYKHVIVTKIDSILSNDTSYSRIKTHKIILSFSIDEEGNVKNFKFEGNIGISHRTDSVIIGTMTNLKFTDAAVYNPCSQKRYLINLTLPITIIGRETRDNTYKKK